jgi:hypothetical protein
MKHQTQCPTAQHEKIFTLQKIVPDFSITLYIYDLKHVYVMKEDMRWI